MANSCSGPLVEAIFSLESSMYDRPAIGCHAFEGACPDDCRSEQPREIEFAENLHMQRVILVVTSIVINMRHD